MSNNSKDHHRALRLALVETVRALRSSVAAGRPITLPNCLRLLKRQMADARVSDVAAIEWLRQTYRQHQPFRQGARVIRVGRRPSRERNRK